MSSDDVEVPQTANAVPSLWFARVRPAALFSEALAGGVTANVKINRQGGAGAAATAR